MPDSFEPVPCPLITEHTRKWQISDSTLEKLYALRNWDITDKTNPVPFKWPKHLRTQLWSVTLECQTDIPLEPRNYQLQQSHHMARMPRFICGDGVGLGKTLSAIMACAWLHDRLPRQKIIIFATKSTVEQWSDEVRRFSTLRPWIMRDTYGKKKSYEARFEQLKDFLEMDHFDVLICKYSSLKGKRRKVEGKDGRPTLERVSQEILKFTEILKPHAACVTMIFDEGHKFKSTSSQIRIMVQYFAKPCARVWAMTASVIVNSLEEFYSIACAIGIRPHGYMAEFRETFCIYRETWMGSGMVEILEGYRHVEQFRREMRPFFFGRSQAQVKEPLPRLTTVIHPIDLDAAQTKLLLHDIPSGAFHLPPALIKVRGQWHEKERDPDNEMTMLSVYQLVANHAALLDPANQKEFFTKTLSPKEECLLDLLDGDYQGEHCLVFTKYRMWIDRLQYLTENKAFTERKFLRITGAENEKQRGIAKRLFQDPDSGHDLLFINSAATEGVNLQQAGHLFALDLPWSWGQLLQLIGRMVRMASPHSACTFHIFVARGTIDEFTVETLKGKKTLFEAILGESHSAGVLDDKAVYDMEAGMEQAGTDDEFHKLLKAHAKSVGMKMFLKGQVLEEAQSDVDYKMTFESGAKKRRIVNPPDDWDAMDAKWGM